MCIALLAPMPISRVLGVTPNTAMARVRPATAHSISAGEYTKTAGVPVLPEVDSKHQAPSERLRRMRAGEVGVHPGPA
jgi:hypothetical protein